MHGIIFSSSAVLKNRAEPAALSGRHLLLILVDGQSLFGVVGALHSVMGDTVPCSILSLPSHYFFLVGGAQREIPWVQELWPLFLVRV